MIPFTPFCDSAINARPSLHPKMRLLVIALFLFAGCEPQTNGSASNEDSAAAERSAVQAQPLLEQFTVPNPTTRPPLRLSAEVVSAPYLDLSFPIDGTLMEVNLRAGRIVTPDLPAARLNPAPLREAIDAAMQIRTRALSAYTQAEGELRRQRLLFEAGSVEERTVLAAEELMQAREYNQRLAEQQLAEARAAEAASSMVGGVNGIVRAVHAEEGETLRAGQALYTIETDDSAKVSFRLPAEASWVLNEPVEITIINPGDLSRGMGVSEIEAAESEDSFIVTLKDPSETLRVGDAVTAVIRSIAPPSQIIVPFSALLQDEDGVFVILLENGEKQRQPVQPGEIKASGVALEGGLSGGEILMIPKFN
jgi:RND family efflux transporter MFP subunit